MAWDVSKQVTEVSHSFKKAIPADAKVSIRIDKVRPGANAIMEATLSEATLVYRAGAVEQRQTVHWELVKFHACWLTHVEAIGFEKDGESIFPTRKRRNEEVSKELFARGWNQLLPTEITDEWMAAVLTANPLWYDMLRLYIPMWWVREWMPEKLETQEDEATGEKRDVAAKGEPLGEDFSE
jgi:hypothetical protein